MKTLCLSVCTVVGLLAINGFARAQDVRVELPEGIRQLIRAATEADQQARAENGNVANEEAARKARRAHRRALTANRDYWIARFEFNRVAAEAETARQNAAEAQSSFRLVQVASIPDAQRMQKAEEDRDAKLEVLADAEFKLEAARQPLESASNPGGIATPGTTTNARPITPPEPPVPDSSIRQPGSMDRIVPERSQQGWRFVFRNDTASYHLLGQTGTASYSRGGQPHLAALDFIKESQHFLFYRPRSGDPAIVEWAFAKYPEFPAGDGDPKFAVWRHDREGWHWEWTHRDATMDMPTPGPVAAKPAAPNKVAAIVADPPARAN